MKKQKRNWQKFRKIIRNYLVRKKYYRGLRTDITDFLRMLGKDMVERLVRDDIRMQAELEAKKRKKSKCRKNRWPHTMGERTK